MWGAKEVIPLYQTILWLVFAGVLLRLFWRHIDPLIVAILGRIERGAPVTLGGLSLGAPPSDLPVASPAAAATTEGRTGAVTPEDVQALLKEKKYPPAIAEQFFLIHAAETVVARTTPHSGRYRVRLWVEALQPRTIGEIESVTYRLYDDFSPSVISTTAREKDFELWLSVYGEFNVVAVANRVGSADPLWLTRYLDLPGRPPD